MQQFIIALDQGTTSSRAVIFDTNCTILSSSQQELTIYNPRESWVEQDAMELWSSQLNVTKRAIEKLDADISQIAAIGITNQRETTILWNRKTGIPAAYAIGWQCKRSLGICAELRKTGQQELIQSRTGLVLDPYFSASKIRWLFDKNPDIARGAEEGEILFGTVDTWLLWNLTGGKVHATDYSNASRTMLMNLESGFWDEEILELFRIPHQILPEIRPSVGLFGETDPKIFGLPIPICGIAGDQHAALFGHRAFEIGDVKNTYGTGCFILMNVGDKPVYSTDGLLSTVAWGIDGKLTYALEGSVFMAGALLKWLKDDLQLVENFEEVNRLSEEVADCGGLYLISSYQGLGSPWWASHARGALIGLTRASKKAHVCRAYLESIAYRSRDVLEVMSRAAGKHLGRIKVDGGVSNSDILMRIQADILGKPVERPGFAEMTALGIALMAAMGAGVWEDLDMIAKLSIDGYFAPPRAKVFEPTMEEDKREKFYTGWLKTVKKIIRD
ncbi:Glycerol kinase [Olavius algarvensis spirochete endosymbiont]|uniref:glycerol kinase GlpK n=1 Tax=Olavius algarvensis spirochete endosymbiont TaxID=260710 RepID=UPI000F237609|nr:glycerol kinase GlpK [Olavius algarvensis spirochete endosymbiont]VDB00415.1 Glycerol kinase [Olavius algarvensis spirochete endosymbiont]